VLDRARGIGKTRGVAGVKPLFLVFALALAGCSAESRTVGPDLPQTDPKGADDPRGAKYERNVYQVAQGGRYFTWYGCGGCHGGDAKGALNLGDKAWVHGSDLDQVYRYIESGHPGALAHYGERIPTEQLWQITAYVRNLPQLTPERRRRQDVDQTGEPQGSHWPGAVVQ
jgi:mono/diheme cytochrome c family protein